MCLKTNQKEPIILNEDKVVWKEVVLTNNKVRSGFMDFHYELNKNYKAEICIDKRNGEIYKFNIEDGFHAFLEKQSALNAVEKWKSPGINSILVECLIPKGSEYYEGEFNSPNDACVSNQIIIKKIMK